MSQQHELNELLSQLAGNLKEDDLNDPELSLLLSQIVMVLEGHPIQLPEELIEHLSQIQNKKERFVEAAQMMGIMEPKSLKLLAESMDDAGLFKHATSEQSQNIGVTRSGRGVYFMRPAASYKHAFTTEDHKDAAALHHAAGKARGASGKKTMSYEHHSAKHTEMSGDKDFSAAVHWSKHKESLTRMKS